MKKINLILLLLLGVLYAQSVPQLHQRVQNQYQNLSSFRPKWSKAIISLVKAQYRLQW